MDIEHITHQSYRVSIVIAMVLSGLVVVFAALVGRGTLNLKGALLVEEPTDVTVIAAVEPKLEEPLKISNITFLRKEKKEDGSKPDYSYLVKISDGSSHLVRLSWIPEESEWGLIKYENLHGVETKTDAELQAEGTAQSL